MTNEELVSEIKKGRADLMGELWYQVEKLVKSIANRYSGIAEFDDLVQECYFAMVDAVKGYEEQKGSFANYLAQYVRAYISEYIRNGNGLKVPQYLFYNAKRYDRCRADFMQEHGREPDQEELAELLEVSLKKVEDYAALSEALKIVRLDAPIKDGETVDLADTLPGSTDIEAEYIQKETDAELHNELMKIIDKLPEDRKDVVIKYYLQGMSTHDIAELYGATVDSISSKRAYAVDRLKFFALSSRPLKEYKEEIIGRAYRNNTFFVTRTSSTEELAIKLAAKEEEKKRAYMKQFLRKYMKEKGFE